MEITNLCLKTVPFFRFNNHIYEELLCLLSNKKDSFGTFNIGFDWIKKYVSFCFALLSLFFLFITYLRFLYRNSFTLNERFLSYFLFREEEIGARSFGFPQKLQHILQMDFFQWQIQPWVSAPYKHCILAFRCKWLQII